MENHHDLLKMLEEEGEGKHITPKQAQILQAAVEIFAEKGYASSSTSEIAAKAGVAEGTIFRHYKTKKDLLISIATPVMTKFTVPFFASQFAKQVFDEPPAGFEQLLRNLIKNRFEFAKENIPLLKIILQEFAFHQELQENFQHVFKEEVFPKFERMLEYFKQKEQIIDYPSPVIIRLMMSTIVGFIITRFLILPEEDWDDEKELEQTIQYILNGLSM
ncbi:TetR/AcrR family transcriptional regulator [Halobacillus salinarum]|uniref:TetR/AcrR family transcriptional regulator n=1 Tax=Halobacillus salinarum TaxID=2932257 RepID=A0ABY4EIQ6_9BACI|nr:TetR/AcrR family transcriptional regulator [Halobacillus salinarum]UOQ43850.1 TetR/AcrR family transcriptional regulator [Halobacillus salinarum]